MPDLQEFIQERSWAPRDSADKGENAAGLAGFVRVDGWLLLPIVICSCQSLRQ
jgi:hypothetical protein